MQEEEEEPNRHSSPASSVKLSRKKSAKIDFTPNCTLVRMNGNEELALATPGESYIDNGFLYVGSI